jgi:predicted permease
MIHVLNTLLPVFAIIGLAYWLGQRGALSQGFLRELNWLIFRVSLPALIVHSLATAPSLPPDTGILIAVFLAGTVAIVLLAFPASRLLKLAPQRLGTFAQAAFRGNLAYVGLPIVIFALSGQPQQVVSLAVAQLMFVLAPSMLFYNTVAVILLEGSRERITSARLLGVLRKVATNPLILASIGGTVIFLLPWELPKFLLNTLQLTGQMAAPASLFCVGGATAFVSMAGRYRSAMVAATLKVAVMPALTALLLLFVDVEPTSRMVLLIISACPTAVASYIMATELGGDEALAAGSIILSTVASIPVFALILAFS